jgi:RNA polymerase sigma factor (sigma-70 family)
LRTLTRLWNQIKHGEIPLQEVIRLSTNEETVSAGVLERLSDTIAQLHELAADLRRHRVRAATASISVIERRQRRRERARVWRQWLSAWETLTLRPNVDETLRLDLEYEVLAQPDNVRLRRAQRAWMSAKRQFNEATAHMLRANLRLVVHVAMRFRDSRAPLLDLIQEGNLGLMRAIEKFEPERGLKFITYAHWWVRQAIGRALINQGRTVRLPGHIVERHNKVRAATDQLWRLSGQAPSVQEIGDVLGWTPQEVERLQMAAQETMPLDKRLPDSGRTLADLIEDPSARNPNAAAEGEELRHCLEVWFDSLKPREAMILRRRYGFETGQPQSLQEVGDALGISRERVRQIEKATLERLRESPLIAELDIFMRN